MCGHHEHGHGHGHHHGHHFGRGRRGFPSREQWVERLESLRERLERDLRNVDDLLQRLREERPETTPGTTSV
jgi:ribosomal protein L19E